MNRPTNNRPAVSPRRSRGKFSRFLFYFSSCAFLGAIVYILFFSPFLAIESVKITGNKLTEEEVIMKKIQPVISGKMLKIINKDNLLLARKKSIRQNILNQFRQIRTVAVKKKFPSELQIIVLERIPTMVACARSCFILDENGQAYDSIDLNSEEAKKYDVPKITDRSGKNVNLGDAVLNPDYMRYVAEIKNRIPGEEDIALANDFRTPSFVSGDIRAKTEEGWEIYFNNEIDFDREMEVLKAVLKNEIAENQRADLEYIDLRINNKAYYKFKEGTPEAIAAADITTTDSSK